MAAAGCSNVGKHQTAWRHFPEDISLYRCRCDNLQSVTVRSDSSEICDVYEGSRHLKRPGINQVSSMWALLKNVSIEKAIINTE